MYSKIVSANTVKYDEVFKTVAKFQIMVGFTLYSFSMLLKFEVLHGQSQPPDPSQSGSKKGSTNKVTMAHDIPILIHYLLCLYQYHSY